MLKYCSAGRPGWGRWSIAGLACFALLALPLAAAAADLLEKRESLYNNIFIFGDGNNVSMTFGQNKRYYTESAMQLSDPGALIVEYTRFMTMGIAYPVDTAGNASSCPFAALLLWRMSFTQYHSSSPSPSRSPTPDA